MHGFGSSRTFDFAARTCNFASTTLGSHTFDKSDCFDE